MAASVTKQQIVDDLRRLGLKAGDSVLVHSSLSSIGRVEGGAETVIEALLAVLGPSGTLLMPSFNWLQPYDPDQPSRMGAITEAFRRRAGVVRGLHPTHPVNAVGPRAEELLRDHVKSPTACGSDTPFGRLIATGGKILMLGVDHDRNTAMHSVEQEVEAPYLRDREASYLDADRQVRTVFLRHNAGPHRDFIGLDPLLCRTGAQVVGKVGGAVARLVDARAMREVMLAGLREDAALVLCDNPECEDCVKQRRAIRLARLAQESFTLSALASSVSAYPDEIAHELGRAGIADVVVDRLYGRPVWMVSQARLRRAAITFEEEGIRIGAMHCSPDSAAFAEQLARLREFGVATAIVPLPPDPGAFLEMAGGATVLFENAGQPSSVIARVLGDEAGECVAFNPAAFALAGEKPFLDIVNQTSFRRRIGLLYLTDTTFGGRYTRPGRGNGEVKELLSVLRCRSFAGRVVIATGPGGPCFRDLVDGFWELMDRS
jgi:aminoglycoside 3-N-acetyltransferase